MYEYTCVYFMYIHIYHFFSICPSLFRLLFVLRGKIWHKSLWKMQATSKYTDNTFLYQCDLEHLDTDDIFLSRPVCSQFFAAHAITFDASTLASKRY